MELNQAIALGKKAKAAGYAVRIKKGKAQIVSVAYDRNPRNSSPDFYTVAADGKLSHIGDKGEAYKFFKSSKTATPDRSALVAERAALVARIAEIDVVLGGAEK